jgi:tetratricopeptide (TPR) repeat protein
LKKYKEALECYDKAIAIEQPINVFALSYKGSTLEKIGELENALDCYNEAINIKPNNAMAYYGKGSVLNKLEKYEMALECIDKALELSNYQYVDARIDDARIEKGLVLSKLGKYEEALECYNEAINIDPTNVRVYTGKGWVLSRLGRYGVALECNDKALELSNYQYAPAWNEKGFVLLKLGKYEEALECYTEAINIDPTNVRVYTGKGRVLSRLGRYGMALECIDKALELKPEDAETLADKGIVLSKMGEDNEALQWFDRALELSNYQHVHAWIGKGFALEKTGKLEAALECYNKIIEIEPENTAAWNNKGFVLSRLEKSEEALECYNETLKIDLENVVAFKHRAFELKKTGRYKAPIPFSKISNKILRDILQEINKNLEDYDFIKNVFDKKFSNENKSKTYLMGILDGLVSMSLKQASYETPFEKSAKIFQSCQNFCGDLYGEDYKQIFSDLFNTRIISRFRKIVLGTGYNMGPIKSERECKDLLKDFERTFGELGAKAPTLDEIGDEISKIKNKNQSNYELIGKV